MKNLITLLLLLTFFVVLSEKALAQPRAERALAFAQKTLDYVEKSAARPKLAARLQAFAERVKKKGDDAKLEEEILALRREIIFSHPALNFDDLLINKRPVAVRSGPLHHMVDHYLGHVSKPGPGLVRLRDWKTSPKEEFITRDKLPKGTVTHPDLSFDGKKIVFAFCDHTTSENPRERAFHLWEIGVDGTGLRQLTGDKRDPMLGRLGRCTQIVEDFDPCYLPDGGIAFTSTRTMATVRCANYKRYDPAFVLHRCEGDGSKIRPLSFGELNEYDPDVQADGKLLYTRWEYVNRNITTVHGLWNTRTDGTATSHFYGNNTIDPNVVVEAKQIPGSRKVVATAAAHHAYYSGSIIRIDPEVGEDGLKPLTRITPEVPFPEQYAQKFRKEPLVPDENGIYPYGLPYSLDDKTESAAVPYSPTAKRFAMPFPLNEDLFLVSCLTRNNQLFEIYLIDTLGGRERIFGDGNDKWGADCWAAIPLRSRKRPPVHASQVSADPRVKNGTFYIQDVYQNRFDKAGKIKRGTVTALRINQPLDQPAERAQPRGRVLFDTPKRILGTVPVEKDGSTAFEAPAGVPLQLQLLDKDGMAVMTMRSFIYLQPGEVASCVGCHEPKDATPPSAAALVRTKVHPITPPPWQDYDKGFSFSQTIQPILDRKCIGCHGLNNGNGKAPFSLLSTPQTVRYQQTGISTNWPGSITVPATESYLRLLERRGFVKLAQAYNENLTSKPYDYFAHAGKLAQMLQKGHRDKEGNPRVTLTKEELRCFIDWLDVNAPFAGTYSWNRPENRTISPEGEKKLRAFVQKELGKEFATQPIHALVNVARPQASRVLLAPLAEKAGGWGTVKKWNSKKEPAFVAMKKLVNNAIIFSEYQDIQGTCGRGSENDCKCKACWIRERKTSPPTPPK